LTVSGSDANQAYLAAGLAHWAEYGFGLWIFYDRGGRTVGRGGIRHAQIEGDDEIEIAYSIVSECCGLGFATEIARESVKIASAFGIRELVAFTLTTNTASRRVMEKAGFHFHKEFMHHRSRCVLYRLSLSRSAKGARP
jgi:ribosomal-protein-alanine N-acetyltransferase